MRVLLLSVLFVFTYQIQISSQQALKEKMDAYAEEVIKRHGIPGLSIAVVKNGEKVYHNNFGYASLEHQVNTKDESIYRIYSITKIFVSVALFQLVEEGKISLTDEVGKHYDGLPEAWQSLKIQHLITHSTGFPDMAPFWEFMDLTEEQAKEKVFAQDLKFEAGSQYDYNQTNFWLLQRIIEKVAGHSINDLILKHQFSNSIDSVFLSSDSRDVVLNRVTPYFPFLKGVPTIDLSYMQGDFALAMNGLNITMNDFIKWSTALQNDTFLKKETKELMWKTFNYSSSDKVFANGWDKMMLNNHPSYGFTGGLVTAYRIFPEDDMAIFFLSNGLSAPYSMDHIINHFAHIVDSNIFDPDDLIFEELYATLNHENFDLFKQKYTDLKSKPAFKDGDFEGIINGLGYSVLGRNEPQKAIAVFEFNVAQHPNAWNVYDSLGEAYDETKDYPNALKAYQKALSLNQSNEYNRNEFLNNRIKIIKAILEKN
ncbi:MAG: serine hydrolase [Bacteroidota bacterium]